MKHTKDKFEKRDFYILLDVITDSTKRSAWCCQNYTRVEKGF